MENAAFNAQKYKINQIQVGLSMYTWETANFSSRKDVCNWIVHNSFSFPEIVQSR